MLVMGATRKQSMCCPWLPEVPSPQGQGADVQQTLPCRDCSHCLLQKLQSHCEKSSPGGHQTHQSQHQAAQ
ncbi:unnamed protein product [Gulo gulo]|uniref:Uncharacterized protein n=1 Tax=Gulo gulo TaxID=48420 RepID=A0A9X9Q0K9_GULGU|nr:unnamed protein product [Gulo gulo]